ncbi:hypothetical protein NECAME_12153 [Necator americanus]|uniref:Uncharacterized protein n=1 Tax=Necator americanus TaxID=51031 RepID=W2T494_NECAM|nr:hypothetical protein NECAME_12153 [Necator americanus]ETN75767.1 hypothetical protein NECAME_12153 [Necator americanus]
MSRTVSKTTAPPISVAAVGRRAGHTVGGWHSTAWQHAKFDLADRQSTESSGKQHHRSSGL